MKAVARGVRCGAVAWVLALGPRPRPPWAHHAAYLPVVAPVALGPAATAPTVRVVREGER